ncbi:transcriptional regulator [Lentilitoribacter sp. Alg239-R112]|jgi:thioredoxin-related protein|uniref:transcriptional regulator n=1 Tax=Lentilitoribacter sp. Alg239-R112 TaxID=2305987 RepID=UPI001FCE3E9D|nr:transcriptional regulator [Lentilitoribacter sp. Alg239-R112]
MHLELKIFRHFAIGYTALIAMFSDGRAAELIMLEQPGCAWCQRWHQEIGSIYPKTGEGLKAPLRQVNIHQPWPEDLANIKKERFTPTFIVVSNGVEIGRLRGYTGDEFFWYLLNEVLDKLPDPSGLSKDNS